MGSGPTRERTEKECCPTSSSEGQLCGRKPALPTESLGGITRTIWGENYKEENFSRPQDMRLPSKAKLGQSPEGCYGAWTRGGAGLEHMCYGVREDGQGSGLEKQQEVQLARDAPVGYTRASSDQRAPLPFCQSRRHG